ncbi:MAG: ATP-binding cassette domain-containing protein [Treponema sp.]|nr:ATP-binding cassette domain-containing protein [Treponema sp.]
MKRRVVIQVENLSYTYPGGGRAAPALKNIRFTIREGERVAVLGANGSGKSTLLSCLNGLVIPEPDEGTAGAVQIHDKDGAILNPAKKQDLDRIRGFIGTVMQNPDDQIISSVVEEDVAFGPENLGLTKDQTEKLVEMSLVQCGLENMRTRQVRFLSGGEKQRLALAGVLALGSPVIVFDEALSMIDPAGRERFLALLEKLNGEGKTLIQVTHSLEEAFRCKRCLVLCRGELVFDGTPSLLLERPELRSWGFVLSEPFKALRIFSQKLPGFSVSTPDADKTAEKIIALAAGIKNAPGTASAAQGAAAAGTTAAVSAILPAVCFSGASHEYRGGNPAVRGMKDVSFTLPSGKSLAIIGTSGSGKSTVLRHINALLLPGTGRVTVLGKDTLDKKNRLVELRTQAALSVQSPESALFEEYVADDVAFGPANAGLSGGALKDRVKEAMEASGLPFAEFADRKTFSLSGGEKRRAAIAGTAAMDSPLLLLDEPLAGLDGIQRGRILSLIKSLTDRGKTIIITTHSMECASCFDMVGVMSGGTMAAFGPPREIFGPRWNAAWDLALPWPAAVARRLAAAGIVPENAVPLSAGELDGLVFGTGAPAEARQVLSAGPDIPCAPAGKRPCRKTGMEFFHGPGLEFLDRPSALRSISGRIKLPLLIAAMAAAIVLPPPFFPAALLALILVTGAAAGRIGPGHLLRGLVTLTPWLLVITALQQLYSGQGGTVILPLGRISITAENLVRSASLFVRVALLTSLFSLYSAVTPLRETLEAFNSGLSLFRPLGFPSGDVSLGVGIAMRFVPVLEEEAERIVTAQLSRGGKKSRVGMMASIIVPLFLRSLERMEKLTVAVVLRLYGYKSHG